MTRLLHAAPDLTVLSHDCVAIRDRSNPCCRHMDEPVDSRGCSDTVNPIDPCVCL